MNVTIRRATIEDAEILSLLAVETFYDTFKGTCTEEDIQGLMADFFNVDVFRKELADEKDYCYIAELDNIAVGYMRFKEDAGSFPEAHKWKALELKRLYVSKEYHGKGIAKLLTDKLFSFVNDSQYKVVYLSVWEYNFKAQKFYEKIGFSNSGFTNFFPIGSTPQYDFWYWKFFE